MKRLLIANRGEIAVRIAETARAMGVEVAMICSALDRDGRHLRHADRALCIGGTTPAESYLDAAKIIAAALRLGADAVHPGYGFLAENADFAAAVGAAGLTWVGPPAAAIRAMGLKDRAKQAMAAAGVAVLPGWSCDDEDHIPEIPEAGYPLLVKPVAGGGGKGMQVVAAARDLPAALAAARRTAQAAFGDGRLMLERLLDRPRHVELQICADSHGHVVHLFDRDCSVQRRHQKVVEEAPAADIDDDVRAAMAKAAVAAARAIGYAGVGTVEFLLEGRGRAAQFWFMEMNTRLQVEHRVTEAITGIDLVEWQLRLACGEPLPVTQAQIACRGHAVELRLYAEAPARGFLPSAGRLRHLVLPEAPGLVIDRSVDSGDVIGAAFDPLIAKLVVHGDSRDQALGRARAALAATELAGVESNQLFLARLLDHSEIAAGPVDTGFVERAAGALTAPAVREPIHGAVLAMVAGGLGRPDPAAGPWTRGDGWRLNLPGTERRRLLVDGMPLELAIDHGGAELVVRAAGAGHAVRALTPAGPVVRALVDGVLVAGRVVPDDTGVLVFGCDGRRWAIAAGDVEAAGEASAAPGDDGLRAPLSGRVLETRVTAGSDVVAGARLVLIEAMKMEHWLAAPRDGVVACVRCTAGDQVAEGMELVRFAPAEPPPGP